MARRVRRSRLSPSCWRAVSPRPPASVAQTRADAGQQLVEAERLGHVVRGAVVEARHRAGRGVARRQHDDREVVALGSQPAQHREAVDAGQADVERQQVEGLAARELGRLQAVADRARRVALGAQPLVDERGDARLVLGDEDARHPSVPSSAPVRTGTATVKREPRPGTLSSSTRPPCEAAMAATIGRPRPEPRASAGVDAPEACRWRWPCRAPRPPGSSPGCATAPTRGAAAVGWRARRTSPQCPGAAGGLRRG